MKGQKSFDENLNQNAYGESLMKRCARNVHNQISKTRLPGFEGCKHNRLKTKTGRRHIAGSAFGGGGSGRRVLCNSTLFPRTLSLRSTLGCMLQSAEVAASENCRPANLRCSLQNWRTEALQCFGWFWSTCATMTAKTIHKNLHTVRRTHMVEMHKDCLVQRYRE